MSGVAALVFTGVLMFSILGGITLVAHLYSLNNIKSKTVGDGQHGTARWATKSEIKKTYRHVPFTPERWRQQAKDGQQPTTENGKSLPQGIVAGCKGNITAMVDAGDGHVLMIGAAGAGKLNIGCVATGSAPALGAGSRRLGPAFLEKTPKWAVFHPAVTGL